MGAFFFCLEIKTSKPALVLLNPCLIPLILNESSQQKEKCWIQLCFKRNGIGFRIYLNKCWKILLRTLCVQSVPVHIKILRDSWRLLRAQRLSKAPHTLLAAKPWMLLRWPRKLTYHIISPKKVTISKGKIVFQPSMFKGYGSFQESIKGGPQRAKEDQNDSFFVKILKNSSSEK